MTIKHLNGYVQRASCLNENTLPACSDLPSTVIIIIIIHLYASAAAAAIIFKHNGLQCAKMSPLAYRSLGSIYIYARYETSKMAVSIEWRFP